MSLAITIWTCMHVLESLGKILPYLVSLDNLINGKITIEYKHAHVL